MGKRDEAVTVVIPAFNAAATISQALDSVFRSCAGEIQAIVVDDGSTDDTARVVAAHPKSRQVQYIHQPNAGVSAARNRGISAVNTPFIGFLDADDEYCENMLSRCIKRLIATGADLVSVDNYAITLLEGEVVDEVVIRNGWISSSSNGGFCEIMRRGGIGGPHKAVFRTNLFDVVGTFDESLKVYEDLDLWTRIALHKLAWDHLSEPLVRCYARGSGTSLYSHDESRNIDFRRLVMRKYLEDAFSKCDRFRGIYHEVLWDFGVRYIADHRQPLRGLSCLWEAIWAGRSIRRLSGALRRRIL